jgi:peptidoglycan/xylan/chitin deacetylase (PgdA/CDA1 family)
MYHAITKEPLTVPDWCFVQEECFQEQMTYLRNHCDVIPLREIRALTKKKHGRPKVAITFDDGFQSNYDSAWPILRKLNLPATIFLATDFIGSNNTVWFCRLNEALSKTSLSNLEWDGTTYDLSTQRSRTEAHAAIQERLKTNQHSQLLAKVYQVIQILGGHPEKPIHAGSPYRMLGATEVQEMAAYGLMDFGAHTCSHAILSGLSKSEREREITESIASVERLTGLPCTLFAFPNGRLCDFGASDVEVLEKNNISVAVTTVNGPNNGAVSPLGMHRYGVGSDTSMALFKFMIHHALWLLRN